MIRKVGRLVGTPRKACKIADEIWARHAASPPADITAAYIIWSNPLMAAGGGTFIHAMLKCCGIGNVFKDVDRYPIVSEGNIRQRRPDVLLLASEPYSFNDTHVKSIQNWFPRQQIFTVDGEIFSWYGSRILRAAGYFKVLRAHIASACPIR